MNNPRDFENKVFAGDKAQALEGGVNVAGPSRTVGHGRTGHVRPVQLSPSLLVSIYLA